MYRGGIMAFKRTFTEETKIIDLTLSNGLATLIVVSNTIYVLGNVDVNNEELRDEITELSKELFDESEESQIINVVYSESFGIYNIIREGSEAEMILGDIDIDFNPKEADLDNHTIEEIME